MLSEQEVLAEKQLSQGKYCSSEEESLRHRDRQSLSVAIVAFTWSMLLGNLVRMTNRIGHAP